MIILNTTSTSDAFFDWNFWFALFNLGAVLINTYLARKIYKEKKEVVQVKNDIQTIINNNVSAHAVASIVMNDEDAIREISAEVSKKISSEITTKSLQQYTQNGHPPTYVRDTINGPNLETKAIIYTHK